MNKKTLGIIFIVIAVLSIILAIAAYSMETGHTKSSYTYGGDAYTGIQNASAGTANNIYYLAKIVSFGLGSVLLITGLICASVGAYFIGKINITIPDTYIALPGGDNCKGPDNIGSSSDGAESYQNADAVNSDSKNIALDTALSVNASVKTEEREDNITSPEKPIIKITNPLLRELDDKYYKRHEIDAKEYFEEYMRIKEMMNSGNNE